MLASRGLFRPERENETDRLTVLADTMISNEPLAQAIRAEKLGVHMICWHLGYDHRTANPGLRAIDGLDRVLESVKIPVQVVGGLSVEDAVEAVRRGASSVVIGGPLVPADRGADLRTILKDVVAGVRSACR